MTEIDTIIIIKEPELLLCPFCGSPAQMVQDSFFTEITWVVCTNFSCGAGFRDTKENAIRLWNTRVEK